MRYARNYKGEIEVFNQPPKILITDSGSVMGLQNAGDSTLAEYGLYPVVPPSYDIRTHKLGDIIWDSGSLHWTYNLVSLNTSLNDIKSELKAKLKNAWKETEYEARPYINYKTENSQSIPSNIKTTLNNFYTLLNSTREDIQALSTLQEALDYNYPSSSIQTGLDYVRNLI